MIHLDNVDVVLNGQPVLRGVTWSLCAGQHWALLGPNGSGKSSLLRLIRGELWPSPGRGHRRYSLNGASQTDTSIGIKELISFVSPELHEHYLQQEWNLTGLQVVCSGFGNTDYVHHKLSADEIAHARRVAGLLNIQHLLNRNVQHLSTGELRRILIARALVGSPRVLLLDEVTDGLDQHSRSDLLGHLGQIARNGTQLVYATHRTDELLPEITHRLELQAGQIVHQGPAKAAEHRRTPRRFAKSAGLGVRRCSTAFTIIELRNISVYLDRKKVLQISNWQMRADENWVVLGPNGAGKSTFLKLVSGDLHPAFGGTVQRFDLKPGDSLWKLRRRIGYVSPELQAAYRENLTGEQVIASGFASSIGLRRRPSPAQRRRVNQLIEQFGVLKLATQPTRQMSYGEFRKVLLLRALVHAPDLLLCDEPFDGLDAKSRREFCALLDNIAKTGTRLIITTHHPEDLPGCINRSLQLEKGRVVNHEFVAADVRRL